MVMVVGAGAGACSVTVTAGEGALVWVTVMVGAGEEGAVATALSETPAEPLPMSTPRMRPAGPMTRARRYQRRLPGAGAGIGWVG